MSSTLWIIFIAAGAIIVTTGNIGYQNAKDKERSNAAGEKTISILRAEAKENLAILEDFQTTISSNQIRTFGFMTNSWKIVSEGGLLVQVDINDLNNITEIYNSIEVVNNYNERLNRLVFGIESAASSAPTQVVEIKKIMGKVINLLKPKLEKMANEI